MGGDCLEGVGECLAFWVLGLECGVWGFGLRVWGLGIRDLELGFGSWGFEGGV